MLGYADKMKVGGLQGIVSSLNSKMNNLPDTACPKIVSDLQDIVALSEAMQVIAKDLLAELVVEQ